MRNPWLDIPLHEYEGHMALPHVAQAQLVGDIFEELLKEHAPASVAVLGCAGGNGLERIDARVTTRVVAVDVNAAYLVALRSRFTGRFRELEVIAGDVERDRVSIRPVAMIFVALLLEYVDADVVLPRIRTWLDDAGLLVTVVQLPSETMAEVSPTPYASVRSLAPFMRLVAPTRVRAAAASGGLAPIAEFARATASGKQFGVQLFRPA